MPEVKARIKEGDLLLSGEINERLPAVQNGLVSHYPLDGTARKYFPAQIRYIRDYLGSGSSANSGNHWIELQAFDENGINVALNKTATNSVGQSIPNWVDENINTDQWTLSGMASGTYHTVDLGGLYHIQQIKHWHYWGDGRTYRNTRVSVSVDGVVWYDVFDSKIEGEYAESSAGHTINLMNPGITISPSINTNTTQMNEYIAIEGPSSNACLKDTQDGISPWSGDGAGKSTSVDSSILFRGRKVVRFNPGTGSNCYINGAANLSTATSASWTFTVYIKRADGQPISSLNSYLYVSGNANVNGAVTTFEEVENGWYRVTRTRTDLVSGSVSLFGLYGLSPSTEYLLADWQLEPKHFATSYLPAGGSRGSGRIEFPFVLKPPYTINIWHKATQPLYGITDQATSPMIFQLNGYYTNASISFWNYIKSLRVYMKGDISAGWSSNKSYYTYSDADWDYKEHMYTLVAENNTTFKAYMDGVYLGSQTSTEAVTNISYLSMGNASQPNAHYRNLSLYNQALTDKEVNKLYQSAFIPTKEGNMIVGTVKETVSGVPSDALYLPLDFNTKDRYGRLSASDESNLVYENGSAFVGQATVNQAPNPTGKTGAAPYSSASWDAALHADALVVTGWSSGLNSGVPSANIGYHAKWVYEGIEGSNDPCMKFIDRNDEFGLGHRWLGISGGIGTPASLTWTVGTVVTVSWYQKSDVLGKGANVGIYHKSVSTGNFTFNGATATINVSQANKWERVSFSFTVDADWDLNTGASIYVYGYQGAYGTLWVDNVQLEKRNFLKPFVVGTSSASSLEYNLNRDYGMDWSQSWSIIYWKKPVGTVNDALTGYNIESLGSNSNTVGGGYIWWGKTSGSNVISASTPGTIDPNKYFGQWRMVSLTKLGTTVTIKEWEQDGTVHTRTLTVSTLAANYFVNQYGYDLKLGGYDNTNMPNSYYRDLIVSKRAFTDAEVKELFATKMRSYPNKLLVQGHIIENKNF